MTRKGFRWEVQSKMLGGLCAVGLAWGSAGCGDQVEMLNGDGYVGRVLSLGNDTLVVQSEFLGTLRLPRAKISTITLESFGAAHATNTARLSAAAPRSSNPARLPGAS